MVIADEVVKMTRLTEAELRLELALTLFAQDRLTLRQAAAMAELRMLDFQFVLADRKIPQHYDIAEFEVDLENLKRMEHL